MSSAFHIIALAALLITPVADAPFGLTTVPAPDGQPTAIWRGLQASIKDDEAIIAGCRINLTCESLAALILIAIVDDAMRYEGREMLARINQWINATIVPTRADVPWLSPLAALAAPGDCKSYAVAKYAALADAGIAPEDRRLVTVWDNARPEETHMVVVVRQGGRWLVLDNRTQGLVDSTEVFTYQPLHEFGAAGVRDFPTLPPVGGPL